MEPITQVINTNIVTRGFTLLDIIFWFIGYIYIHVLLGFLSKRADEIVKDKQTEKTKLNARILKKLFTWFPFIYALIFIIEYI